MREFSSDELFLKGRIQIETALGALAYTRINLAAEQTLQTILDIHIGLSDGEAQDDLSLYLQGEAIERDKADIIVSLDAVVHSKSKASEAKIAADALRQIL